VGQGRICRLPAEAGHPCDAPATSGSSTTASSGGTPPATRMDAWFDSRLLRRRLVFLPPLSASIPALNDLLMLLLLWSNRRCIQFRFISFSLNFDSIRCFLVCAAMIDDSLRKCPLVHCNYLCTTLFRAVVSLNSFSFSVATINTYIFYFCGCWRIFVTILERTVEYYFLYSLILRISQIVTLYMIS
jgi:hypothetical protein